MPTLNLSPDELLTTTRSVRKRLDLTRPVDPTVIRECVEIALQAPSGSNEQGWHFVIVMDQEKRAAIGEFYKSAWDSYRQSPGFSADKFHQDDPRLKEGQIRMVSSVDFLAENLARVPVFVIPCVQGRVETVEPPFAVITQATTYGSVLPATWSFMLAARARGLGTAWTTLHLFYEREVAQLLGIPYEKVTQVALIPVAHTILSDFKPAPRLPVDRVLHTDTW